jgi:hypothetical protein
VSELDAGELADLRELAERSPPRKLQRAGIIARLQSTITRMHLVGATGLPTDERSAFMKEFSEWRARPPNDMEMAEFWCSETAIHRFPIHRRLFLSVCSTPPDNAESERDFSAMTRLLSPLRRGRMRADTVARKMFLYLNRKYWHPCAAIKDNFYFKALLDELGMDDWLVLTQDSDESESASD